MIIVSAIAIYRRASLPKLIAMQRRVLAETMIMAIYHIIFVKKFTDFPIVNQHYIFCK